ncbi:MFS transporter [Candidatus Aerophobetes bacterium]|uniref:MFS transporter n=1 Tax=Aerophobetes bacterium TaxID=2030807 RepID=A0A2A4X7D2_UNCAE|nr:MAG: MFS transporter [Candidatus Aerophobetes bacterium]
MEITAKRSVSFCYIITRVFGVPFWGLLALMPFIIQKELLAPAFYVAVAIALKPSAALLSPYWSQWVHARGERLVRNLFWGNLLKYLPFIFFPLFATPWFCIASLGVYMVLLRGTMPAWMELLNLHMDKKEQKKLCAAGSMIDYIGALALPFLFGWALDHFDQAWRYLFPISGALGMLSCFFIAKLPKTERAQVQEQALNQDKDESLILKPWKGGYALLKKRPDFLRFQLGFFLGGAGLMLMHSVIPVFTATLKLSYKELLMAISLFKGIGFVLSTPLWVKWFAPRRIFTLCSLVILIAAFFPVLLQGGTSSHFWVYIAYAAYGVMQGGSELCWKMAGSIFAGKSDSAPFSSFSVLAVGVRGLIFPFLGTALLAFTGEVFFVMLLGSMCCFFAAVTLALSRKSFPVEEHAI